MDSYRSMVEVLKQMKSVKIIKYLCHHEMEHKPHFPRCRHLSTAHCWTHHHCHPQHGYFRGHVTHEQLSALSNHPYNCWHTCFEKILGAVAELWNLAWGDVSTANLTNSLILFIFLCLLKLLGFVCLFVAFVWFFSTVYHQKYWVLSCEI